MRPEKSAQGEAQGELYQRRLSTLLDQSHPLKLLAEAIDWEFFEREFAALYHKARGVLVPEAQRAGLELRQSYKRVGKRALQKQGRYAHAEQLKRARKETRKLRTYLGRVMRDIQRKSAASGTEVSPQLQEYLERAARIYRQQRADKHKLYSMQAPGVECISKGKEHKKYEFG